MRKFTLAALTVALAFDVSSGLAQSGQTPAAQSGPQNPAVKTDESNNSSMPVKGANSFSMSEARSHIMRKGYTHVSGLKKDNDGVWRGTAMKAGQQVSVSIDYQGNVIAN